MGARSEWNRAYYGRELGSQQIVIDMQGTNPGADPLREVLTRYSAAATAQAATSPPPANQPPPPASGAPTQLQPRAPVQQQSLPPPR